MIRVVAIALFFATPSMAFAYVDPGTGAYLVQALIAMVVAVLAYIRHPIKTLRTLWERLRRKNRP
ncbi:hypothetical protein LXT12_12965 [Pelomonas sp. P7]|uniref:Uncharacterized protein n=1 Tax=Pelomonas caseinilytica TaxID=2906763 RepID=A0ABS8XFA4_9BURK|nr:hypothetical protein [Pelomonas sp. P7]MCE4538162.1 hypothetical protein [Pelomonas sp. P7]